MPSTVTEQYRALVAEGEIERDAAQDAIAARLTRLEERLAQLRLSRKSSHLGWLFARSSPAEPIKGLYIHGDVGRGKTMLMDLFFAASAAKRKRRAHFHEFMADVHERVHLYRQKIKSGEITDDDPIGFTAAALAEEAWLLCFDEFHVTDIADAMILGRLFTRLFEAGVVVVATSNVEPDELYKDGLNRALFVPFIALLHQHMDVVRLAAPKDFRLEKLSAQPVWYVPADEDAEVALDNAWQRLTGTLSGEPCDIAAKSRVIRVPEAARGVARFSFRQLCEQPLGASDYLRIAREFHTLILENVPVMDYPQRNEAKRFIALIDTLYDNGVKLVASAAAEPTALYLATDGYEANEFKRTASRLIEMRSEEYLALPHGHRAPGSGSTVGIVET
ncbi:MAG: cell division protein ZapE [Alphaproteobacteria bacterium]